MKKPAVKLNPKAPVWPQSQVGKKKQAQKQIVCIGLLVMPDYTSEFPQHNKGQLLSSIHSKPSTSPPEGFLPSLHGCGRLGCSQLQESLCSYSLVPLVPFAVLAGHAILLLLCVPHCCHVLVHPSCCGFALIRIHCKC